MIETKGMAKAEWLNVRRNGIGGSDVGAILGLSKYKSAFDVWLDKTNQTEINTDAVSESAYFGTLLEDIVAKEFSKRTGLDVIEDTTMYQHKDYPFLFANIDRLVVGEDAILECKTASEYLKSEWENDNVPVTYYLQVQHYLNVLDKPYAYIACLIGGNKFIYKKIERDDTIISVVTSRLVQFWKENVLTKVPPRFSGHKTESDYLNATYGTDFQNETVKLTSEIEKEIDYLKSVQEKIATFQTEENRLKNELKQLLGKNHATYGTTEKYKLSWKKSKDRTVFNESKFKTEHAELYNQYLNVKSGSKTLRITELKK